MRGMRLPLSVIGVVLAAAMAWLLLLPAGSREVVVVDIPSGASVREIAAAMKQAGFLRSETWFHIMARLSGRPLKAGEYGFKRITPWGLLRAMQDGRVFLHRILVKEGDAVDQVAQSLEREKLCGAALFMKASSDRKVLDNLGLKSATAEGFCYPDTYLFPRGMKPEQMLSRMVEHFFEMVPDSLATEAAAQGLSRVQWVALASIVEKEARVAEERPVIAGVYLNRLRKGMRLEADPTVVYALKHWDKPISIRDLKTDHPYNTYKRKGLPPGPICNPGLPALEAAARPARVPYLFFVTRKDGSMRHHFSKTLAEHEQAIQDSRVKDRARKKAGK